MDQTQRKADIQKLDLTSLRLSGTQINWEEFLGTAGQQHYKLLAYLGAQWNGVELFDIGTHRGASALALSHNTSNRVHSFDISQLYTLPKRDNIEYHVEDLFNEAVRADWESRLLASPCILLDIDPHEGTRELVFYQWLLEKEYKGLLVCDDIWYFKEMRDRFWYKIPTEHKVDVTEMGHWSGTGIVRFDAEHVLFPAATSATSNWTVVTAYFDLTAMPDASMSIKARPSKHYLDSAKTTMALDQNMLVFCEPGSLAELQALRPPHLAAKTKYITMSFEDFPMTQYRDKVIQNRKEKPYQFDDRNTASYYLFCVARYAMMKQAIAENPFQSTHFAWLNICIERMGWKNAMRLSSVFAAQRDRLSTCYIDYIPKSLVENTAEYFKWGRCSMCSGFFTGDAAHMKEFCDRVEGKFLKYVEEGYGHADEQLYSPVFFDAPHLFEHYYGDYQEMITNYVDVRERPGEPLRLLISRSFAAGDWGVCLEGCKVLWASYKKGVAGLSKEQVEELVAKYRGSLERLGLPAELA